MKEVENVIRLLRETQDAVKQGNASRIKELSNQTINTASFTQDPDNIAVAVVVYSLGKVFEREHYRKLRSWNKFYSNVVSYLEFSIKDLEAENIERFRENFMKLRKTIEGISGKVRHFIQDVFNKAQINKASRIYEHGVSMEQTANLLGVTMFELADYAGGSKISDAPESRTISSKQRIKFVEEMFA